MFCSKCGIQIKDDAVFCLKCGTSIKQVNKKDIPEIQLKKGLNSIPEKVQVALSFGVIIIIIIYFGFLYHRLYGHSSPISSSRESSAPVPQTITVTAQSNANEIIAVQTGEIIRCEKCGEVLRARVKTVKVKRKDAGQYNVSEISRGVCTVSPQRLVGKWVLSNGCDYYFRKRGDEYVLYNSSDLGEAIAVVTYRGKDKRGWFYYKGKTVGDYFSVKYYMNPCGDMYEQYLLYPVNSEWEISEWKRVN